MNNISLLGRLTADPELRHTQNQVPVTSFSIAVDRRFSQQGQERQVDFINIVAWRGTAEFVSKYFSKGKMIALTGSLQARQYTDKSGNKRTAYEVVADQVYFTGDKVKDSAPDFKPHDPDVFTAGEQTDFEEITGDDDLPF